MNDIFEGLAPMASKKVAVVIGRFNPPTKGHYAVIDQVKKFIRQNKNLGLEAGPAVVIIGGSKSDADKKRNPLSAEEREVFMKASGKANACTFFIAPNAFAAFSKLREQGYEPIAIAGGPDRVQDYLRILNSHFKTPRGEAISHHGIELDRDEDAIDAKDTDGTLNSLKSKGDIGITQVSGSVARRAVELGYEPEFAKIVGLEDKPALAKKMFDKIKSAIGTEE